MEPNVRRQLIRNINILLTGALVMLAGCGTQQVQVPTSFTSYESDERVFACEYPKGWEFKGGGKNGKLWAKFSSGPALISIKATTAGSLMSDAMGGRTADTDAKTPQDAPVHSVHMSYERTARDEFSNYTEIAGSPTVLDCRLGPGRLSEFTASTSFGTALHGYRATIIGFNKGVSIFCSCPEADWAKVKPAFDHLLSTLKRGEGK